MSGPEHLSLSLTTLLNDLSRSIPACDPQDVSATRTLKQKLGELQNTLEKENAPFAAEFSCVAARLVDELAISGLVGPKETMAIVGDIVTSVRGALGMSPDEVALTGGSAGTSEALRLIDGQRLGELLITLSMLSPEHVERALRLQKLNGLLLGEALVEQGVLTKDSIQAALRLQDARRRREGGGDDFDAWRSAQAS